MATIDITKTFADGDPLLESDLDNIIDDVETFLNTTKINDDNIQDSGITASTKLADGSISTAKLASSVVTTAKILDDAVTAAKIADGAIDDAAKLASNVVTTAKILDSNVTTAKIADSNVTTAKIADSNVTTAKIADSNVTTTKIADSNVTKAKLSSVVQGSSTTTSASSTPSATVALTCSGRPCLIYARTRGDGTNVDAGGKGINATITPPGTGIGLYVGVDGAGTILLHYANSSTAAVTVNFCGIYTPSAGSRTFSIMTSSAGAWSVSASGVIELIVVEL